MARCSEPGGKYLHRRPQQEGALADVLGGHGVGQVHQRRGGSHPEDGRLHLPYIGVCKAKVSEQADEWHGEQAG